jgi:hypothetical protein
MISRRLEECDADSLTVTARSTQSADKERVSIWNRNLSDTQLLTPRTPLLLPTNTRISDLRTLCMNTPEKYRERDKSKTRPQDDGVAFVSSQNMFNLIKESYILSVLRKESRLGSDKSKEFPPFRYPIKKEPAVLPALLTFGAEGETRTPMPLRALDPEPSVSTNSTTSA